MGMAKPISENRSMSGRCERSRKPWRSALVARCRELLGYSIGQGYEKQELLRIIERDCEEWDLSVPLCAQSRRTGAGR